MPKLGKEVNRLLWSTVSKALAKSKNTAIDLRVLSSAL